MTSIEFWQSIKRIAADGFTKSGLLKIDDYAEQFIRHQILFKRFSSNEQYGCSKGGRTHVIASLLAGAEVATDKDYFSSNDFKSCRQHAAQQIEIIKSWAEATNLWFDNADKKISRILGKKIAEGGEAIAHSRNTEGLQVVFQECQGALTVGLVG